MVASCTNTCAQCAAEIEAEQRGIREKIYEPALEKIREWRRGWIRTYAVSTMVAFGGVCFVTLVKSRDEFILYGRRFTRRLLLGTAGYDSPSLLADAIALADPELLTVSLRRQLTGSKESGASFWNLLRETKRTLLPNSAGCVIHSSLSVATQNNSESDVFAYPSITKPSFHHLRRYRPRLCRNCQWRPEIERLSPLLRAGPGDPTRSYRACSRPILGPSAVRASGWFQSLQAKSNSRESHARGLPSPTAGSCQ